MIDMIHELRRANESKHRAQIGTMVLTFVCLAEALFLFFAGIIIFENSGQKAELREENAALVRRAEFAEQTMMMARERQ